MTPRNVRLNNPGNIRRTNPATQWVGLAAVQSDPDYCEFVAPQYGFRAMARILHHYELDGVRPTVLGYISKWAPPKENDTRAYVADVADLLGVDVEDTIEPARKVQLLRAMAMHEGGHEHGCPWGDDIIQLGIELAQV